MTDYIPHSRLKITAINDTANQNIRQKLLALGLLPGTVLTILNVAPMGGPIQLEVRNTHFSLRRNEMHSLEVESLA